MIATTHSPIFIDVAKPHTTIIRVGQDGGVRTRLFSTDKAAFDAPARERLMMIRACHPTVNEFFFADQSWLVEGETEHAVLNALLIANPNPKARYVCVVNCLGKANLCLFARILNQFATPYTIIHDSDSPKARRKGKLIRNAMWTTNESIREIVAQRDAGFPPSNIVVHIPHFEGHYFGDTLEADKPFYALSRLGASDFATSPEFLPLRSLVDELLAPSHPNTYRDEAGFLALYNAWRKKNNPQPSDLWDID